MNFHTQSKYLKPTSFLCIVLLILAACSEDVQKPSSAPKLTSVMDEQQLESLARGIHERVITLDTHADINTNNFTASNNYSADINTQVNLPKMEAGGLDVAWLLSTPVRAT